MSETKPKVKLTDHRKTKAVELPSFPNSEVVVVESILVGDLEGANFGNLGDVSYDTVVSILPRVIKSWNFTDDAGNDLTIDKENIKKLPMADVTFLFEQIAALREEAKKGTPR